MSTGGEAKGGETKQVGSTKISFDIFNETVFTFLLNFFTLLSLLFYLT